MKAAALELGLPVTHSVDDVVEPSAGAELGVVVAFGQIIKPHVLAVLPMVNVHFSLLPRWRGAAPVERALLAGDDVTGVCVMRVEEGLDTGGVYAVRSVPIGDTVTADELRAELVAAGTELLVETLAAPLADWIGDAHPQQGEATYAAKFSADDFEIDWAAPVVDIHRLIRVGGAWTTFRSKRLKIHAADLVDGRIMPTLVAARRSAGDDASRRGATVRDPVRRNCSARREDASAPPAVWNGGAEAGGAHERQASRRPAAERPGNGARRAPAHRGRGRVRQPRLAVRHCSSRTSANSTASSSPNSSTARPACVGRATSSSIGSSPRRPTR